ncbi:hypothetical protein EIN_296650 [Entamoeba invadens IP1]|uniref:Wntless-like transmembrane domain-containing protein n=1 Tax=Entamoeba invadens IP1 TaxID=370355 RepID=L7FKY2_ENTIV|nr:hypothetical protein EIN_296650 [Entamoeba invadens IP1]ELP86355.1 hypothetical protein EIN_296650 [Entamoeba invadens IP1]|eukprot:XP_004185701.1 hypothetical protein EIN_296650 [Entamoeba invadens IP1]
MEEIVQNEKKRNGILMNTISLPGLLFVGLVFLLFTTGITIVSFISPKRYLTTTQGLWNCSNNYAGVFDKKECKGWDSYATLTRMEEVTKPNVSIALGPFGPLNKDVNIKLLIKNVFTTSAKESYEFTLDFDYSLQPFTDMKYIASTNYVLVRAHKVNVKCEGLNKYCDVDFSLFRRFSSSIYERFDIFSMNSTSTKSMEKAEFYLTIDTYNSKSTMYEVIWRLVLVFANCVVLVFFLWSLRKVMLKQWPFEEVLTALLIYGLIFFNNPFCFLEYMTQASFFMMVNTFFEAFFLGYMMFYILAFFNLLRRPEKAKGFIPLITRAVMGIVIGCTSFGSTLAVKMTVNLNSHFTSNVMTIVFGISFLLAILAYLFWLAFDVIRSFSERRKMSGPNKNRTLIFGIVTFGCIIIIASVAIGVYFSGYMVSNMFIGLMAYVNLYCFFLTILCLPSQENTENTESKVIMKLDTELKVEQYDDDGELIINDTNTGKEGQLYDEDNALNVSKLDN